MGVHRDDQSPRSPFEDLPVEITRKVLEKIPIDSLALCKLLSKSFCRIINDQEFAINILPSSSKKNPFVLVSHKKSIYLLNMDSNLDDEFKKINIPFQLPDVYIIGSCNGYLCLSASSVPARSFLDRLYPWGGQDVNDNVTFVWNPLTSHFMELPLSAKPCSWLFGFGFHTLTREYKIVKIYYIKDALGRPRTEYMQIFTLGTDVWRTLRAPSDLNTRVALRSNKRGVCVNGSVYWSGKNESNHLVVLALDLATEEFIEIRAPYDMDWSNCQSLTEIRGCLAMLVFQGDQLEIWVIEDSWTLQFLVGDYSKKMVWGNKMKLEGGELKRSDDGYTLNPDHALCLLEDDRLLMYFAEGGILFYDFKTEVFVDFKVRGLPGFRRSRHGYEAIALAGSFIRIE